MLYSKNMLSFCKLLRCCRGATLVEYAIVAPILMLLLMGTLEFNLVMYASAVLEGATNFAARLAKTGYTNSSTTSPCSSQTGTAQNQQQFIQFIAEQHVGGLMNPCNLTASSKTYSQFGYVDEAEPYCVPSTGICYGYGSSNGNGPGYVPGDTYTDINGNGQWDSDIGVAGLGGPGDIVVYTLSYPWPIMTPWMRPFFGNQSTITLTASAVVKNEPYPTSR